MRIFSRQALLAFAAVFALSAGAARAGEGLTGAAILTRPIGARASGMGRAFTAMPGSAESVLYNPAGPGLIERDEVYLAYMNGFGGGGYGLAAVPFRLGDFILTPAYLYYDSGRVELESQGVKETVTAELDRVAMVSGAYSPFKDLSVGGTIKFTSLRLAEAASASVTHYDLGALYRVSEGLTLGAASLNNGGEIKFEEKGDPSPATLRAGLAYRTELRPANLFDNAADVSYSELVVTADWSRTVKEKGCCQAGAELNMKMAGEIQLSLRGGYLFGRPEEGLTLGFGVKKGQWDLGFAYECSKDLGSRYPVSISRKF